MLQKGSTSDIELRYNLLYTKHTTDKAVICSTHRETNGRIFSVGVISLYKIKSVTEMWVAPRTAVHNQTNCKIQVHHPRAV